MTAAKKKVVPKIALKRQVRVQSVVTNKLRKNLLTQIDNYEKQEGQRLKAIEAQLKTLNQDNVLYYELESMRQKLADALAQVPSRREQISALKNGALYHTGVVEGMVNLAVGDDFYKKVYGMGLLLEDGVIKDITFEDVPPFAPLGN
eukprot:COSAG01_NODE_128_length_24936_cov_324.347264_7_plen_147_part_00